MRKKLVIAFAMITALAFAGIAIAAGTQKEVGKIKLTAKKAGGNTGFDSTFGVSDPGNTTPGKVGKPTRQIVRVDVLFPKGIKFSYKALPICNPLQGQKATDVDKSCKKSLLGKGTTTIDARQPTGGLGLLNGNLHAYNTVNGLVITVEFPSNAGLNQILRPSLTGHTLITKLPTSLKVIDAYLTKFHLLIKPHSGKIKGKKTSYAALPKKCTKAGFKTAVKYYFDGGGTFTTPAVKNACKK